MNIYVGNLSTETNEDGLTQAFSAFGQVESVRIVRDRDSGQSKGFGFVTMQNEQEAQMAIDEMNGKELDGQTIKVEKGRVKTETIHSTDIRRGPEGSSRGGFRRDNRGSGGGRDSRGGSSRGGSGRGGRHRY
jgi:RNA recognition motif-containing protein